MYDIFSYFHMTPRATISLDQLDVNYFDLVKKEQSERKIHEINQAYQKISDPSQRVYQLFLLRGIDLEQYKLSSQKLLEYFDLQETIEDMQPHWLEQHYVELHNQIKQLLSQIDEYLEDNNLTEAIEMALEVRYVMRLQQTLSQKLDESSL